MISKLMTRDEYQPARSVSRRVLVIDDEADVRAVVQGCLEDVAGWEVITARSGSEGLTKVATEKLDAIILDVMMPDIDGLTFLKQLKSNPDTGAIPVVLLTAKVSLTDPTIQAELGVLGAIAKPFNPISLSQQIARFLGWDN